MTHTVFGFTLAIKTLSDDYQIDTHVEIDVGTWSSVFTRALDSIFTSFIFIKLILHF
jgi:hypothetical protein